jgi:hypothetical protein
LYPPILPQWAIDIEKSFPIHLGKKKGKRWGVKKDKGYTDVFLHNWLFFFLKHQNYIKMDGPAQNQLYLHNILVFLFLSLVSSHKQYLWIRMMLEKMIFQDLFRVTIWAGACIEPYLYIKLPLVVTEIYIFYILSAAHYIRITKKKYRCNIHRITE